MYVRFPPMRKCDGRIWNVQGQGHFWLKYSLYESHLKRMERNTFVARAADISLLSGAVFYFFLFALSLALLYLYSRELFLMLRIFIYRRRKKTHTHKFNLSDERWRDTQKRDNSFSFFSCLVVIFFATLLFRLQCIFIHFDLHVRKWNAFYVLFLLLLLLLKYALVRAVVSSVQNIVRLQKSIAILKWLLLGEQMGSYTI